jgi:hypothetical protein
MLLKSNLKLSQAAQGSHCCRISSSIFKMGKWNSIQKVPLRAGVKGLGYFQGHLRIWFEGMHDISFF